MLVPPVKPAERWALSQGLWALGAFDNEDTDAHLLLCQAVFIAIKGRFDVPAGTTRILLASDGRVLASDATPLDMDPVKFAASFRAFIHGQDRLRERAKEIEASVAPDLRDAMGRIGSADEEERRKSMTLLAPRLESLTIPLSWRAEAGASEVERRRARSYRAPHQTSTIRSTPLDGPRAGGRSLEKAPESWLPLRNAPRAFSHQPTPPQST